MNLTKNLNDFSNFSDDILLMMNPSLVELKMPKLYYKIQDDNLQPYLEFFSDMTNDYLVSVSEAYKYFSRNKARDRFDFKSFIPSYLFLTNKGYLYTNSKNDSDPKLIMTNVSQIVSGDTYHLILKQGRVYSIGRSKNGSLGLGPNINKVIKPTLIKNLRNVIKIDNGMLGDWTRNVALVSDGGTYNGYKTGHVYTWGDNGTGNLGLGNMDGEEIIKVDPVNIANEIYTEIGSQEAYSVFNGPSVENVYIPTRVNIDNVIDISMNIDTLYILVTGNKLYATGEIMDSTWIDVPVRLKKLHGDFENIEDETIIGLDKYAVIYGDYENKSIDGLYRKPVKILNLSYTNLDENKNGNVKQVISDALFILIMYEENGMNKIYLNSDENLYNPIWNYETGEFLDDLTGIYKVIFYQNSNDFIALICS